MNHREDNKIIFCEEAINGAIEKFIKKKSAIEKEALFIR